MNASRNASAVREPIMEELDAFTKEEQEIREREREEKKEKEAEAVFNDSVHSVAESLWGVTPQNLEATIAARSTGITAW